MLCNEFVDRAFLRISTILKFLQINLVIDIIAVLGGVASVVWLPLNLFPHLWVRWPFELVGLFVPMERPDRVEFLFKASSL
jgi:hypothetical protein